MRETARREVRAGTPCRRPHPVIQRADPATRELGSGQSLPEDLAVLFRPDLEHPLGHVLPVGWVDPLDISNAMLFLASDEARYVPGVPLRWMPAAR